VTCFLRNTFWCVHPSRPAESSSPLLLITALLPTSAEDTNRFLLLGLPMTMATHPPAANERPKPPAKSWSSANINSRGFIKHYDKSPVASPPKTPPNLSRNNSSASIRSTQSEPTPQPQLHRRHTSEPSLETGDFNELRSRKSSAPTHPPAQTHKKSSAFKSLFSRHKEKDPLEELKRKTEEDRRLMTGKRVAAARVKKMLDPSYREFQQRHQKPNVKTAGIKADEKRYSVSAEQEMSWPHSGSPALKAGGPNPMLSRIESRDAPDDEVDPFEARKREWTETRGNIVGIPEIRSRQVSPMASPWASPMASREPSPNRAGFARPPIGSRGNSWAGGYQRDERTGRWTKKPSPGVTPPGLTPTPLTPRNGDGQVNPDALAASLAARLNMTG